MEWKHGYEQQARSAFRRGAKCAHGATSTYSPLFQAWAQFEEAHGHSEQAALRMQQYLAAESAEQRRGCETTPEVIELAEALDLRCVESPLPEARTPQPV